VIGGVRRNKEVASGVGAEYRGTIRTVRDRMKKNGRKKAGHVFLTRGTSEGHERSKS